jgi:hypothetical protein
MNPEARIKAYLDANKGSLRFATIDQIVQQVKLFVFYGASPISDDDVRKIVSRWAIFNPVWLLPEPPLDKPSAPPASGPTSPTPDPLSVRFLAMENGRFGTSLPPLRVSTTSMMRKRSER